MELFSLENNIIFNNFDSLKIKKTNTMKKIVAFGASTSSTSINKQLAAYAGSLLESIDYEVIDLNDYKMPIYSEDEEKNGFPENAKKLSAHFKSVDGFIISFAEHNGSFAAAYKNIFDWISRLDRKVFNDKPVLLMATSPGGRGGANVLEAAKNFYPHMGAKVTDTFSLAKFYEAFQEGAIIDNDQNVLLKTKVAAFENVV